MMELEGRLGKKVQEDREKILLNRQQQREVLARQHEQAEEARRKTQEEKERKQLPVELVKKMVATRIRDGAGSIPIGGGRERVDFLFRLRETTIGDKAYQASLRISGEVQTDARKKIQPLQLGLKLEAGGEVTEHPLTTVCEPLHNSHGMPEDYGFRTYTRGEQDSYEVSSYVPQDDEAEMIVSIIKEAAELDGVYDPELPEEIVA